MGFAKPHPPFRRPILFCLARNCNIQPLFLCAAKKKPLAVKRKRQRGICVGTNSTSLILSAACGGQASSVPLFLLFPHESLRWVRVGALAPFAIPLKRPRRGLRPPSLDHPRGLVCAKIIFESTKRDADASFLNWRGSRNTLRLFQVCVERQSVCARYATLPLQEERPIDFHTSNIQRAQTKRPARRIVRSGNPILWPPKGRSLRDVSSVNGTQKQNAFSGATALFRTPASLFCILFSDKPEKSMPPEAVSHAGKKAGLKTPPTEAFR